LRAFSFSVLARSEATRESLFPKKPKAKTININSASQEELISILQISKPLAQKIIALGEELGGFENSQALTQLPEITTLDFQE
jgi:DNA uptake protein ComE-like DNA-binding protein